MKSKIIYSVIILVVAIGVVIYYYTFDAEYLNIYSEKIEHKLSAIELFNKFEEDENQANAIFLGNVIEVSGKVADIQRTQDNEIMLILKDENEIFGVICTMKEKKLDPNSFHIGDELKIKGVCKGYLTDVIVNDCIITK